jgi:hypothetical protein
MGEKAKKIFEKIEWGFIELIKTFSNEKSYFSSKRIERAILFWIACFIILNYYRIKCSELTPDQILILTTPLFVMCGFNSILNRKEKNDEMAVDLGASKQ